MCAGGRRQSRQGLPLRLRAGLLSACPQLQQMGLAARQLRQREERACWRRRLVGGTV